MKKSASRILKETRVARETELVEKLIDEIGKDSGLAVYGEKETRKAAEMGALEDLIVSEQKVSEYEKLIELAEKHKSIVTIISSEHESGEKFLHLGGIAGLLRFRMGY